MTLHEALLAAALRFVTIWTNPHTGEHDYIDWCRRDGGNTACEEKITWAVKTLETVADRHGLDPWTVLNLSITESRLDPRALSKIGAFGLLQLHPKSPAGKEAKLACRQQKLKGRDCDAIAADLGGRVFKRYLDTCGTERRAVYAFRTGRCGRGPYSDRTINSANKMRRQWTTVFAKSNTSNSLIPVTLN